MNSTVPHRTALSLPVYNKVMTSPSEPPRSLVLHCPCYRCGSVTGKLHFIKDKICFLNGDKGYQWPNAFSFNGSICKTSQLMSSIKGQ